MQDSPTNNPEEQPTPTTDVTALEPAAPTNVVPADEESIARVEKHLGHCRSCYSRTQMERTLTEHIRKANRQTAPGALQSRLRKLMDNFD